MLQKKNKIQKLKPPDNDLQNMLKFCQMKFQTKISEIPKKLRFSSSYQKRLIIDQNSLVLIYFCFLLIIFLQFF